MITRCKLRLSLRPLTCSTSVKAARLSQEAAILQDTPEAYSDQACIQWLTTTGDTPPPPITTRLTISSSPTPRTLSLQLSDDPDRRRLFELTPSQSYDCALRLLTTVPNLHRRPSNLPRLTIEYSSPNIAKPLHMGHLRSTITGSYVANMGKYAGHNTKSVCFLGDWGKQFGVLHAGVLARMREKESQMKLEEFVETLSLNQLLEIYVWSSSECKSSETHASVAHRLSSNLESESPDNSATYLWSKTRQVTLSQLKLDYKRLGVNFDEFQSESTYRTGSKETTHALSQLDLHNLTYKHEDGSLRARPSEARPTESILLKKDQSSLYLLRDIACAMNRLETDPRHAVYVVDMGQSAHFTTLFDILGGLGVHKTGDPCTSPFTNTHTHVPFGKVSGMSTRSGTYVLLSDVLEQGTSLMHESRKKSKNARNTEDVHVSEQLAVSGLIVNALKVRRTRTYAFDWNDALKSKGNSGVALQYTLSRLNSLVTRVQETRGSEFKLEQQPSHHIRVLLDSDDKHVMALIASVANFEDTFWRSYLTLEPCILVTYAFHLSDKVSKLLSTLNLLKTESADLAHATLWLFETSHSVLLATLSILTIKPVGQF